MIGIYLITNKINGHTYIGQSKDIEKRWKDHKIMHGSRGWYLQNAFKKYGAENFNFEVLEECLEENLDIKEIEYISKYKSEGKAEYNLAEGGYGNPFKYMSEEKYQQYLENLSKSKSGENHPNYGKHLSDETKQKISESQQGYHNSSSTEFKKGHIPNPESVEKQRQKMLGRTQTEKTKQKRSDSMKGKNNTPVICITNNKVYNSMAEAAEELNLHQELISKVCRKERKSTGGYKFEYKEQKYA
jgi:group I intron endonuclease